MNAQTSSSSGRAGRFLQRILNTVSTPTEEDLRTSALVFAPHPDDETLGCGGTILRKRDVGADVGIVFMTDGRTSHRRLISEDRLVAMRAQEAIAASRVLGVDERRVTLLDFADGQLDRHRDEAQRRIVTLLREQSPREIYIPCREEPPRDHWVTREIVLAAAREVGAPTTVLEYPVWFWYHWPWVSVMASAANQRRTILKNSLRERFGLRFRRVFNYAVSVDTMLERKRSALEQHATQMSQIDGNENWLTLEDVCDGEWLACFFQGVELFRRYDLEGAEQSGSA